MGVFPMLVSIARGGRLVKTLERQHRLVDKMLDWDSAGDLEATEEGKDLRVLVDHRMSMSCQSEAAVKKADASGEVFPAESRKC